MLKPVGSNTRGKEGYIYVSYGHPKYLKHVVASVTTLRRYDTERPVALACTEKHKSLIKRYDLEHLFDHLIDLPDEHASIVGFKHNFFHYLFFDKNLFLDSDIVWCKDPDPLWKSFDAFEFTITGNLVSDNFFGAPKSIGVVKDVLLLRRRRTLKRFGLTYLSRAQTGIMYSRNYTITKKVCEEAKALLNRKSETHFQSRKKEKGRNEESCEWSLAMAMSKLNVPIFAWFQGQRSPQLDYIQFLTEHDEDFEYVKCKYYCNDFVYSFRGLKTDWLKNLLIKIFSIIPGKGDHMMVTPYCLHFGWYHEKQPFFDFSERVWEKAISPNYQRGSSDLEGRSKNDA
ncbi:hypothetical protein [Gracilimonas amylolytica]|uniref:hypothetical protein n=1 Tax=Gracilimonas amylolytica TaxID=1749045 RepID=UPI000CD9E023|nr:hypothetical protein [Gracilimonas amylolytica]